MKKQLTHVEASGRVRMVDVSGKKIVRRRASARGYVKMSPATLKSVVAGQLAKGDVFNTARLAGIAGAKRAWDIIPLCHPIPLTSIAVEVEPDPARNRLAIRSEVVAEARTGVEMEALTAVLAAALAIYDMAKAVDKKMEIGGVRLVAKSKEGLER